MIKIEQIDALKLLQSIETDSVDLVVTDPPYYRIKDLEWDKQWKTQTEYLSWIEQIIAESKRILKPNGSFYMFASNKMATNIDTLTSNYMQVKNNIVWFKEKGIHQRICKARQRTYFPASERVIFAVNGDTSQRDKNKAYSDACEPIIDYFRKALSESSLSQSDVNSAIGTQMAGHWFGKSQWRLPSSDIYNRLKPLFNGRLNRSYESLITQRNELLKLKDTEHARPFDVSDSAFYTDVWICSPVQYYDGKHPCEKPQALIQHIIKTSSRGGDLIVDPFVGGGSAPYACKVLGRDFIGSELDDTHYAEAVARLAC